MYEEIVPYVAPLLVPFVKDVAGKVYEHALDDLSGVIYENLRKLLMLLLGKDVSGDELLRIPPKILIPALQAATLCDEDELRELWANLLRNAANGDDTTKLHPAYVEILRGLSPQDALMLKAFAADVNYRPDTTDEQQMISRDNLRRLSVIENNGGYDGGSYRLSPLGAAFLRAVSDDRQLHGLV